MAQAPPILVWSPGGGVSSPIGSNPPVYSQADVTQLIEGQAYIDIVFGSIQTTDDWVLVACEVENTIDLEPLNIWPGIITDRSTAGFRIQLNGMPDSGNYYLSWAVSGINIEPALATTYFLTGFATGAPGEAVTFTVSLPPSTYVNSPVTVTPSEGGLEIGVFSPETVTLTTDSPSATFTFTPGIYGETTITVNNDRGLTDPVDLAFTVLADTYTLSGPSDGDTGTPSTDFTVELPVGGVVVGTVTVTPSDGGDGGTFTPTTVALTTASPSATFTYTPASDGDKTISVTNDGDLTDPADIVYTATTPWSPAVIAGIKGWWKADSLALSDGAAVATWADSSINANTATGVASPVYKTNQVNSKPVVRLTSASSQYFTLATPIVTTSGWTVFAVMKKAAVAVTGSMSSIGASGTDGQFGPYISCEPTSSNTEHFMAHGGTYASFAVPDVAFHVFTGTSALAFYIDGLSRTSIGGGSIGGAASFNVLCRRVANYPDGDVAEIIVYEGILGTTDRQAVENYLMTKYAITAVSDPGVIAGLKLWLRADALGLSDGTTITTFPNTSGTGYSVTSIAGSPKFKTAIVNGKPVVRFAAATSDMIMGVGDISVSQPCTWFFVAKETSKPNQCILLWTSTGTQNLYLNTSGFTNFTAGTPQVESVDRSGAFHVFALVFAAGPLASLYVDGTLRVGPVNAGSNAVGAVGLWGTTDFGGIYTDGDMAEVLLYNTALGTTDRQTVETALKTKYGIA